ncbi:hypothetical protein ACFUC2_33650 [[Kitasatospora] papulosa]|uniref:hypothetical protein n=1 Tax=[Kitasatospora] papulosa TaxID=1464011 RepID=UPI003639C9A4
MPRCRPPARDPYKALARATKKLDASVLQAAMEHNPEGTLMVRELIESLSTSVGIEVEIRQTTAAV